MKFEGAKNTIVWTYMKQGMKIAFIYWREQEEEIYRNSEFVNVNHE